MSCLKVICWALIFIFKLRFPPGVSIAAVLKRLLWYLIKENRNNLTVPIDKIDNIDNYLQ
jgi:hypothetical protein